MFLYSLDRNTTRKSIKKIKHLLYLCQGRRLCDCPSICPSVCLLPKNSKSYEGILIQFSGNDDRGPRNSSINVQWCCGFGSDFDLCTSRAFLVLNVMLHLFHLHMHTNANLCAETKACFVSHKHICILSTLIGAVTTFHRGAASSCTGPVLRIWT